MQQSNGMLSSALNGLHDSIPSQRNISHSSSVIAALHHTPRIDELTAFCRSAYINRLLLRYCATNTCARVLWIMPHMTDKVKVNKKTRTQEAQYCCTSTMFSAPAPPGPVRVFRSPHVALSEVVKLIPGSIRLSHGTALEQAPGAWYDA